MKITAPIVALLVITLDASLAAHDGFTASGLPAGFSVEAVTTAFDQPVGICFADDGRLIVWEKKGVVWTVQNGTKQATPMVDLSEEVGNWSSRGLKGVALDPDFFNNGYVYLLYDVDRHHLLYFGTPDYDPDANFYNETTIARVTRYTTIFQGDDWIVDPTSRTILLGDSITNGIPIIDIHECGTIAFGHDGSLLVSAGDSADANAQSDPTQALIDGTIEPKEDLDAFRAQLIDGLNGKILRLDPATGAGLPDNPFFDPLDPFAPRSMVWAYGLRNPYRFTLAPTSSILHAGLVAGPAGASSIAPQRAAFASKPGVLLIGDVGSSHFEELNLCVGGENFGWPLYEGMEPQPNLFTQIRYNLDAPNPLFGIGGCTQEYFSFQDLLQQESQTAAAFLNPCDSSQQIPSSARPSRQTRPVLDAGHSGPARVKGFDGNGEAIFYELGQVGTPTAGSSFEMDASIGGSWYTEGLYPAKYWDSYFHADYANRWIRNIRFDATGMPTLVREFAPFTGDVVGMATDPISGDLHYVEIDSGKVQRVVFHPNNVPPTARPRISPRFGPTPFRVRFDGRLSTDDDDEELAYEWDFGVDVPKSRAPVALRWLPIQDPTSTANIDSRVFHLVPPQDTSIITLRPEVIVDRVYPPASGAVDQQYLTLYDPPTSKGPGDDWIALEFPEPVRFQHLLFQEGMEFPGQGGWFEAVGVQVRINQEWFDVTDLSVSPEYVGSNGVDFEIFEFVFEPITGDAIRLIGQPGGSFRFVSVAELRAVTIPLMTFPGAVAEQEVTLLVSDPVNASDTAARKVWLNNTPPQVSILSPPNGMTYDPLAIVPLSLSAIAVDQEHPDLHCSWQVYLHHNDHVHPEPEDLNCDTTVELAPHNEVPGEVIYYEILFTATDPLGLGNETARYLLPEGDCNLNGLLDSEDIATGRSLDLDLDGIPDECQVDCDGDALNDAAALVIGVDEDCNNNGIPDECDISGGHSNDLNADGIPDECR